MKIPKLFNMMSKVSFTEVIFFIKREIFEKQNTYIPYFLSLINGKRGGGGFLFRSLASSMNFLCIAAA